MFSIRPSRDDDAELLPLIEKSGDELFKKVSHLSPFVQEDVLSAHEHRDLMRCGIAWVATDERDAPFGFLCAMLFPGTLHIRQMSVHGQQQRRGIGSALLLAAIGWAQEQRLKQITLTTFRDIPWNDGFYKRHGFLPVLPHEVAHLASIMANEAANGLPSTCRCAMRLIVPTG